MKYNHRSFIWDIDAYKLGHMCQYPQDTEYIYSVLQLRSDKIFKQVPVIGLQYLIKEYLMQPILEEDVKELIEESKLMGIYHPETETKLMALVELGYLLRLKPFQRVVLFKHLMQYVLFKILLKDFIGVLEW